MPPLSVSDPGTRIRQCAAELSKLREQLPKLRAADAAAALHCQRNLVHQLEEAIDDLGTRICQCAAELSKLREQLPKLRAADVDAALDCQCDLVHQLEEMIDVLVQTGGDSVAEKALWDAITACDPLWRRKLFAVVGRPRLPRGVDPADIVQDTFRTWWQILYAAFGGTHRPPFRDPTKGYLPYLTTIARNHLHNARRKSQRQETHEGDIKGTEEPARDEEDSRIAGLDAQAEGQARWRTLSPLYRFVLSIDKLGEPKPLTPRAIAQLAQDAGFEPQKAQDLARRLRSILRPRQAVARAVARAAHQPISPQERARVLAPLSRQEIVELLGVSPVSVERYGQRAYDQLRSACPKCGEHLGFLDKADVTFCPTCRDYFRENHGRITPIALDFVTDTFAFQLHLPQELHLEHLKWPAWCPVCGEPSRPESPTQDPDPHCAEHSDGILLAVPEVSFRCYGYWRACKVLNGCP